MLLQNRCRKGFTLIEVLIVVVIIAILAALVVPRMLAQTDRAKAAEAFVLLGTIKRAMERQRDLTGDFPLKASSYIQSCTEAFGGTFGDWGTALGLQTPANKNWCSMYDAGTHTPGVHGGGQYGSVRVWDATRGLPGWDNYIFCHVEESGEVLWTCNGTFENSGNGAEAADPCTLA